MLSAGSSQPLNAIAFKPTVASFCVNKSAPARKTCNCTPLQQSTIAEVHWPDIFENAYDAAGQLVRVAACHRRALLQSTLFTFAATSLPAIATEEAALNCVADFSISDKVFFDISIDREPVGRIVVGLFNEDVPVGAKRFADIAVGSRGISYRKKEFERITQSYIQNAGIRNFSLSGGVGDAAQFTGGETADALIPELENLTKKCPNSTKNVAGAVSIIVRDPSKPPPKPKLIAKDGKFEVIEEELRPDPNGTQFAIIMQDSPQLDASNLVVGKVVDGFDVLKLMSGVRVVKDNTGSPYFK
ncbi:hypothetical protein GOP47_0010461 [Adiantum capillus-veneris]|nr:hypothetical protein GOP47_0010461 [Adiantum capillus-veneris]